MKKVAKKNSKNSNFVHDSYATNPLAEQVLMPKVFTRKAVDLFEKQADIKKFTDMVLQSTITEEFLDNTQAELLLKDIFNPFCDESYKKLAENEKLLNDLTSDTNEGA